MKKYFSFVLLLVILGYFSYPYWNDIKERLLSSLPCSKPIPYQLGTFDSKFNISQKYFLNAITEAEAVWEKAYGKDLFIYTPDSSAKILKINLIYDYRQEATSKLASLGIVVKNTEASYTSLKTKFENLKQQYLIQEKSFNAAVEAFNNDKKAYEEQVQFWNKKGGAPQKEYEEIQNLRITLENRSQELQNMQNNLVNMISEINSMVVVLNRMARDLNINVEEYNTIGASRGESFEEGVYHRDGNSEEIDIYEFSDKTKLVRVLAHEFGHALSIGHVEDSKAIMYRLNQGNATTPTQADLDALVAICGIKK